MCKKLFYLWVIIYLILGFQPLVQAAELSPSWKIDVAKEEEEEKSPEKNPWLAFSLSLVAPGMGQVYVTEKWWPGVPILVGMALGVVGLVLVQQQRDASLSERDIRGQKQRLPDAGWETLLLTLQIALPSLWIWNFADAYQRAEKYNEKVMNNIDPTRDKTIIKGRFLSITLWQF